MDALAQMFSDIFNGNYDYPIRSSIGESWWSDAAYKYQLSDNITNGTPLLKILQDKKFK